MAEKTITGTAQVWTEGEEKKVYYKPFGGCTVEVDLARYAFKSAQEAATFIAKLVDRAGWDSMILANLMPQKRHDGGGS